MGCYERMLSHLQSTRLYDMSKNESLIKAEMKAYATVLEDIISQINRLCTECFFDEMQSYNYGYFEKLFGFSITPIIDVENMTENEINLRQQKIDCMKQRLKISNRNFTKQGIIDAIASWGMTAEIIESYQHQNPVMNIVGDLGLLSSRRVKADFIDTFMPGHFEYTVNFS